MHFNCVILLLAEGSWTAGGGRPLPGAPPGPQSLGPGLHGPAGPEPGGVRTNLGPHPGVGAPLGPAGPAAIPINFPHGGGYRPLQHSFVSREIFIPRTVLAFPYLVLLR